jgi:hypothetical protein
MNDNPREQTSTDPLRDSVSELQNKLHDIDEKLDYLIRNYRKNFCSQFDAHATSDDAETWDEEAPQ